MVKNVTGSGGNDGITIDATGAKVGDEVSVTVTGNVTVTDTGSGGGRVNDIALGAGNDTLVVLNASRDTSQDGVDSSSDETKIGNITASGGDNFVSLQSSGGRGSATFGAGNDTLVLNDGYLRNGANMGGGNDLVEIRVSESVDNFSTKDPMAIDGGSGIDTLDIKASQFTVSLFESGSGRFVLDTSGNGVGDTTVDALTQNNFGQLVGYTTGELRGAFTIGDNGFQATFRNFEEIFATMCFAHGTMIRTEAGDVAVEGLRRGDKVLTEDAGAVAIRWIGSRRLDPIDLAVNPHLRPIRIRAGALAEGLPETDLIVSPQHRILVSSVIAERMVGKREVLVAAKHLVGLARIYIVEDIQEVTYYHFLLDAHRVVWSNGARSESLYTGLTALNTLSAGARQEIFEIFPELEDAVAQIDAAIFTPAAYLMPGRLARSLRARHLKNEKQLLMDGRVAQHG